MVFICIKIRICGSNQLLVLTWFTLVTLFVLIFSWLKKKNQDALLTNVNVLSSSFYFRFNHLHEILNAKYIIFDLFSLKKTQTNSTCFHNPWKVLFDIENFSSLLSISSIISILPP